MLKLLMPSAAAIVKTPKNKTIVIADPHLGWELPLQAKGIHVPSQTPRLLRKLLSLLFKYKPDTLLILGDIKYSIAKTEIGEWHEIPQFFNELKEHVSRIAIVRGNHDANLESLLPGNISLLPASGTIIGNIGFFHGHKWLSPTLLKCKTLIMGHLHPTVVFHDPAGFRITRQVWIKAECDSVALAKLLLQKHRIKVEGSPEAAIRKHYKFKPRTKQIFIMPSFNDFLGGRPINGPQQDTKAGSKAIIGPVLRSEAVDVNNAELHLLDGTYLGTLSQLRKP